MPLPTGVEPRDVVAIIDANDQALAWDKDLAKAPNSSINTTSSHQLVPKLIGKEVIICYGEKHLLTRAMGTTLQFLTLSLSSVNSVLISSPLALDLSTLLSVPLMTLELYKEF
jgi:hypothetical protein